MLSQALEISHWHLDHRGFYQDAVPWLVFDKLS